jgi:hypothetical protein
MNKFRPIILAAAVILAAFMAYGLWTLPVPESENADGFSSARVVKDIKTISEKPHSVAHPQELAKVRDYLVERLEGLGAEVDLYRYDSVPGPKILGDEFRIEAVDILAEFPPLEGSDDASYLMFIAHYDSRHIQPMPKDTVLSNGAADDGYGIGVTLETVSQLLEVRDTWSQGVKILFTDAEESGMQGMKSIWENDRHVFDNVGLIINLEGRGTWGPALLFETGSGNEKVMDLYASTAKYPYTYSLTTVVYGFMPNFTDFTIVKDELPGLNFSTIADINSYHTDKDNFANISEKSIQHYGEQILPLAMQYVTDSAYADKNALKGESDTVNFTIPGLGLFNVSKIIYVIINVAVFIVFFLLFALEGLRGRLKPASVFRSSCSTLFIAIGVLAVGELIAYLSAVVSGARFKPFGIVQGVQFDNMAMLVSVAFLVLAAIFVYWVSRRNAARLTSGSMRTSAVANAISKFVYTQLYGTLLLLFVLSAALVFTLGENLMFFIPLVFSTLAIVLWHVTNMKVWLLAGIVLILLHAFSFLFALAMALTIGAFGAVAMLAFLDIMVLIPLADLYISAAKKK